MLLVKWWFQVNGNLLTLRLCCVSQRKIRAKKKNKSTHELTLWTMPAEWIYCNKKRSHNVITSRQIFVLQQRNKSYKQELAENKPLQPSTGPWSLGQQFEKKFLPQITESIYNAIASLKKMHRAEEEGWSNSSLEHQLQTIKVIKVTADDRRTWLFWVLKNIISAQKHKIAKTVNRGISTPVKPSVCSFPLDLNSR